MSAQDKLGIGMLIFLAFFVIAFLLVPRDVYQEYFASLKVRGRARIVAGLGVAVFSLALPYFYDVLVGFDNRGIALIVQILIGASAYLILIDCAYFTYRNYWEPSRAKRRRR